jgi:hypothetical protein
MNKSLHEAALAAKELRELAAAGKAEAGIGEVAQILEILLEEVKALRASVDDLEEIQYG